jgi:hypothetical protein
VKNPSIVTYEILVQFIQIRVQQSMSTTQWKLKYNYVRNISTLTNKSKYTKVRVQISENPEYSYVQNTNTIKYKPEYTEVRVQLSEKTRTPSISKLVVKPPSTPKYGYKSVKTRVELRTNPK